MKKEMLLAIFVLGVVNSASGMDENLVNKNKNIFAKISIYIFGEQINNDNLVNQPKVFNKGCAEISGTDLFMYVYVGGYQKNPYPEFKRTTIVKLKKNGSYDTQFQLGDIRKGLDKGPNGRTILDNKKLEQWHKFDLYAKANNGIECPDLIELVNREGELKPVTVAIYGTQNVKHCQLYKEYLKQQKVEKDIEAEIAK